MICFAIGAATSPPVRMLALDDDGDGDARVVGRREGDEPGRVDVVFTGLGGSRLAGDLDPRDLGRGAGAAADDRLHHLVELGRVLRLNRAPERVRLRRDDGRAVRRR